LFFNVSAYTSGNDITSWYCFNGVSWKALHGQISGSIYEEGMWWNVTTPGNCSVQLQNTFLRGTYQNVLYSDLSSLLNQFFRNSNQNIAYSDSVSVLNSFLRNLFDGITYSDLVNTIFTSGSVKTFINIFEGVNVGNLITSMDSIFRNGNQAISYSDLVAYLRNVPVNSNQAIAYND